VEGEFLLQKQNCTAVGVSQTTALNRRRHL